MNVTFQKNTSSLILSITVFYSFIQIATEDGVFENNEVKITMTRTLEEDLYTLEWQ